MFALLEDPNIWRSDFLPYEDDYEEIKQEQLTAEKYCLDVLFT